MGLMSEMVAQAVIPAAAAVGILFALLQWFMVSKVSVSGGSREKENLMGDEEDDVDDDAIVLKCAEIQNAISVVREALEDVTALFYDEDRNEIYTVREAL